ncbi:hypothetical protein B0H14DRAFT_2609382 [Mycena olivaceomarginata]|nr:hypothetical protein B0H14DRAFT_2609382 [Mycena olivaceomarginata]
MPRHILPKNPLLRIYPGITLTDGYLSCPTNFYAPADWNRPDHEKPRRGRYHIWTVENGRFDGIHVDAAAKNQATFNAPSATVQLFPTVAEARGYLAQACRCWHTECQERHALASATLQPREQKRSMKRPVGLSREGLPHEVRHLAGDVWAYGALDRLYSFAELSGNLLWLVVGNMFITQDRMRAMREFIRLNGASMTLAMHLHQAILTAVGYDDSKVVVLDNGEIFHDYDDYDADGDDSVESSDGDEDNGGVPAINCRFTAAAIAGQARGGDVWVVPAAQAERLQHALRRPPSRQWPVDSRS